MSTDNQSNQLSNEMKRPSYLPPTPTLTRPTSVWGLEDFSKPPRLFIVQALSGPPIKPPFADGDIIVVSGSKIIKIGNFETPYSFTPLYFFVDYLALNPNSVKPFIKDRSFDPNSIIAKKARAFIREQVVGGSPDQVIKYVTNLNFIHIIHNEEIGEIPVHNSFNRGTFKVGQSLIGLIQDRRDAVDVPFTHRYRAISRMIQGKGTTTFPALDIKNDPEPFVTEDQYHRYEKLSKYLEELKSTGELQTEIDDIQEGDDAANEKKF